MHDVPAGRGGKLVALAVVIASLSCPFAPGPSAQEFTAAQPRPPASHARLACASGSEHGRLQGLLKSWRAAYSEWESALAKLDSAKPAYDQAQAQFDEALEHERSFSAQLLGTMRGSWSPELFAASARRDDAYGTVRAAADEAQRTFNALQAARSADEQLVAEISKRTCARPRAQSQVNANRQAQPEPVQSQSPPHPCRQSIVGETIRCQ